ncbi:MAG: hypothetical protein ACREQ5_00810 [Candidatus Dormibacteria bacterium]
MSRRVHHVGTIPAPTPTAAIRLQLDYTGPNQETVVDGETNEDEWVVDTVRRRERDPHIRCYRKSQFHRVPLKLWRGAVCAPRSGAGPKNMLLRYAEHAGESYPDYQRLTQGLPVRPQYGIPGPLNPAVFTWGPLALKYYDLEVQAAVWEVDTIHALTGGGVLYQLEVPVETVLVAKAPARARAKVAARMARRIGQFITQTPPGGSWAVHLCLGNLHDLPLVDVEDTSPLVELANHIIYAWPDTHRLEVLHLPLGSRPHPAPSGENSGDWLYYLPLRGLALDIAGGVHVSAGLADPLVPVEDQQKALALVDRAVGVHVGVSSFCGLGRRPDLVVPSLARIRALAEGD